MGRHDTERTLARVVDLVNTDVTGGDLLEEPGRPAARRLRARFRAAFTATSHAEAVALVNDLLAASPVTPQLNAHDERLRLPATDPCLAAGLAAEGGLALADMGRG